MATNKVDKPDLYKVTLASLTNGDASQLSADLLKYAKEAKLDLVQLAFKQLAADRETYIDVKTLEDTKNDTKVTTECYNNSSKAFDGLVSGVDRYCTSKKYPEKKALAADIKSVLPLKGKVFVSKMSDSMSNVERLVAILKKEQYWEKLVELDLDEYVDTMDDSYDEYKNKRKEKVNKLTDKSGTVRAAKLVVCRDIRAVYDGLCSAWQLGLENKLIGTFNTILGKLSASLKQSATARAKADDKKAETEKSKSSAAKK